MPATKTSKSRRINIVVNEELIEYIAATAEVLGMTMSAFVRQAVEKECKRTQEELLADSAASLAPLYESDRELTAFSALDGEDFS